MDTEEESIRNEAKDNIIRKAQRSFIIISLVKLAYRLIKPTLLRKRQIVIRKNIKLTTKLPIEITMAWVFEQ